MGIADALRIVVETFRNPLGTSVISESGESATRTYTNRGIVYGDVYVAHSAGSVMAAGRASGTTITVGPDPDQESRVAELAAELKALHQYAMKVQASDDEPDKDVDIGRIVAAEMAAQQGDLRSALRNLQGVGRWVVDLAKTIGASAVVRAIETQVEFDQREQTVREQTNAPQIQENRPPKREDEPYIPSPRKAKPPTKRKESADKPAPRTIVISSHFKLVFLSILAITLLSGTVQTLLAFAWPDPTKPQQEVFEAMGFAWKLCLGSMVGLLGGKAIK